jgi:hypothetical protein
MGGLPVGCPFYFLFLTTFHNELKALIDKIDDNFTNGADAITKFNDGIDVLAAKWRISSELIPDKIQIDSLLTY